MNKTMRTNSEDTLNVAFVEKKKKKRLENTLDENNANGIVNKEYNKILKTEKEQ